MEPIGLDTALAEYIEGEVPVGSIDAFAIPG